MTDRAKSITAIIVAALAALIIIVGLGSGSSAEPSAEDRVAALSAAIKCPFCAGESLADSQSSVAADYRALIEERVGAGWTDEAIKAEFARNFGDSVILDSSTSSWSIALWLVPVAIFVGGTLVIVMMRRNADDRAEVRHG